MQHDLQHTVALLTRTPATLNTLLRDLPQIWTHQNEGENTWGAFDVVGHLIHCEHTDWLPRVKLLLHSMSSPTCAQKIWTSFAP